MLRLVREGQGVTIRERSQLSEVSRPRGFAALAWHVHLQAAELPEYDPGPHVLVQVGGVRA
jgi:hypothetical protein